MRAIRCRHSKVLVLTLVLACLPHTKATTDWALSDSSTVIDAAERDTTWTPDSQIVKGQAFKSFYHIGSQTCPPCDREITLDLGSSQTVEMIDVLNYNPYTTHDERMGFSAFYITDDAAAS